MGETRKRGRTGQPELGEPPVITAPGESSTLLGLHLDLRPARVLKALGGLAPLALQPLLSPAFVPYRFFLLQGLLYVLKHARAPTTGSWPDSPLSFEDMLQAPAPSMSKVNASSSFLLLEIKGLTRYNSYTMQLSCLKYEPRWFLWSPWVWVTVSWSVVERVHRLPRTRPLSSRCPYPALAATSLSSASTDLPVLHISREWGHTTCGLL